MKHSSFMRGMRSFQKRGFSKQESYEKMKNISSLYKAANHIRSRGDSKIHREQSGARLGIARQIWKERLGSSTHKSNSIRSNSLERGVR